MRKKSRITVSMVLGIILVCLAAVTNVHAQKIVKFEEPEEWENYIMDGVNRHHVWARQIEPTKLAIGVLDEQGYISLENDTCIWFRGRDGIEDQLISIVRLDNKSEEYSFLLVSGDTAEDFEIIFTIGTYNAQTRILFDCMTKRLAMLLMDGTIIDPESLDFLLKTGKVNPLLAAYFFYRGYCSRLL